MIRLAYARSMKTGANMKLDDVSVNPSMPVLYYVPVVVMPSYLEMYYLFSVERMNLFYLGVFRKLKNAQAERTPQLITILRNGWSEQLVVYV